MKIVFKYELDRLRRNGTLAFLCLMMAGLSLLIVVTGGIQYNKQLADIPDFKLYEKQKIKGYLNYDQYGGYGFNIIKFPNSLSFYFSNTQTAVMGKIDTKEIVDITVSRRLDSGNISFSQGFAGFIYLWGAFLSIYMGVSLFRSWENFRIHRTAKTIFASMTFRLLFLGVYYALVYLSAFLIGCIFVSYTTNDFVNYAIFSIYSIALYLVFYFAGILIFLFVKRRKTVLKVAIVTWVALVLIPEIAALTFDTKDRKAFFGVNTEKLIKAKEWEMAAVKELKERLKNSKDRVAIYKEILPGYMDRIFRENLNLELKLINKEKEVLSDIERKSLFAPFLYYPFIISEMKGGLNEDIRFLSLIMETKERFLPWYLGKKFIEREKIVVPFPGGEENIYMINAELPQNILGGFVVMFIWMLGILATTLVLINRSFRTGGDVLFYGQPSQVYFQIIEEKAAREKEIDRFDEKYLVKIGRINLELLDFRGACRRDITKYFITVMDVSPYEAMRNLKHFDISLALDKCVCGEDMQILFAATSCAIDKTNMVLNNLSMGRSENFDRQLRGLLEDLCSKGKTIIYFSSKPFQSSRRRNFFAGYYERIPIHEVTKVTFR